MISRLFSKKLFGTIAGIAGVVALVFIGDFDKDIMLAGLAGVITITGFFVKTQGDLDAR